jgi:hypothetical protein
MSSTLFVDAIEPNLSSGVHIAGHVLQVVQTTGMSVISTTSTSQVSTGFSVSITPKSSSSKIYVTFNGRLYMNLAAREYGLSILRGSTSIVYSWTLYDPTTPTASRQSVVVLDSPATTAQTTYTLYHYVSNSDVTGYINPNSQNDGIYSLTAWEIAQ